ncbi:MAG: substrate-binding domain-containing protein [Thermodesulfovibrionales bacterium]|nr:substrate-binding domain-containing protein [Thermodesulfovibrionales bacterium]
MIISVILLLLILPVTSFAVDIKYAGCVTIQENLLKEVKSIYEQKTGNRIGLSGGGAGAGIRGVLSGLVDIGGVSRPLKTEEIRQGLVAYTVGYTAVAVVVHRDIKISNLTMKQLRDILSGKIGNWKEIGGPDMPVRVVIPSKGYASRDECERIVMENQRFADNAIITPEQTISETVDTTPGSIGIVDISMLDTKRVSVVKLEGLLPDKTNIKSGKYKLIIPINLVTKGEATGVLKDFIDFILSPEGQALVERKFIGIK